MFKIKIANLVIGIENKYEYVRWLCREYETDTEKTDFCVSATEQEIAKEQKDRGEDGARLHSAGYCESICLYRSICLKLIDYDAFVMHSVALEMDGRAAYVFAAKSGVGKTTHVKLWLEEFGLRARVVNGDKPIYRFGKGSDGWKLYACGTPWCGKERLGSNIMSPVKAICFLERGTENRIRRLEEGEVIGRIFHQLLMPREETAMNHFLDMIDRMLATVDCYLLRCNMEKEAAWVAYEGME